MQINKVAMEPISAEHNILIGRFCEEIDGWYSIQDARILYNLARGMEAVKGTIVEIGSYCGKSTMCLALGTQKDKVWAIDNHGQKMADAYHDGERTLGKFFSNIIKYEFEDIIIPIVAKSEIAIEMWSLPIKLLFIDGDHTKEGVLKDYEWAKRFLVPGGVVVFHDINHPPIKEVLDEIIRKDDLTEWSQGRFIKNGHI